MAKKRVSKKKTESSESHMVIAALGVMQDEFNGPVPTDEISFCLRIDFKRKIKEATLLTLLNQAVDSKHIEKIQQGWLLTSDGSKIADQVLKNLNQ